MIGDEEMHEHEYGETAQSVPPWWSTGWRMSWGAIFAGLFVALGSFTMWELLGAGIGLSVIGPFRANAGSWGWGSGIWSFVFALVSLYLGGWVAGRFSWQPNRALRALYGLTVWGFFYTVVLYAAVATAGAGIGVAAQAAPGAVQSAGAAAAAGPAQTTILPLSGGWLIGAAIAMFIHALAAMFGSQSAAVTQPPRMAGRPGARTETHTYVTK